MKLKKILSALLVSAVLMIPSASAFAESNTNAAEVTPFLIGVGDTQASAISLVLSNGPDVATGFVIYDLFIQDASEKDWFKWTNTSSSFRRVAANIGGYSGNGPIRAGFKINYNNSFGETDLYYSDKANTTNVQTLGNIFVPPGATVYLVVDAPNFTTAPSYHLNFAASTF